MFVYLIKTLEYKLNALVENRKTQGLIEITWQLRWIKAIFFCKCVFDLLIVVTALIFYEPFVVIYLALRTVAVDLTQKAQMKWGLFINIGFASFVVYLSKYFMSMTCVFVVFMGDNSLSAGYDLLFILCVAVRTLGADFIKMVLGIGFVVTEGFKDF